MENGSEMSLFAHNVECFSEVDECDVEHLVLLATLPLELSLTHSPILNDHSSLSTAFQRASPNPNPVHSDILSSHLFFCLPLLFTPCTVSCRTNFASPVNLVMCPNNLILLELAEDKNHIRSDLTYLTYRRSAS